ncbi:flagellar basal body P-ring formation chaperone FlgA [uncultured Marivita sp.]|uniref:flagellar basal body P-ring formation chaperone FlgA n=1 Tax=uncultured Marivita sp. TaxID=888080 RepID=UPI00261EC0E4|nr:flagellar basal body P-ring formation chaperone FlgA [uncultured Marivita sp.]
MRYPLTLVFTLCAAPALAESVVAVKTLRAREVITAQAVQVQDVDVPGAAETLDEVIGTEVKRAIYAGQAVLKADIAQPALIERNQIVAATFSVKGLTIDTEARALERGSVGDIIRAMNLTSRTTIRAEVMEDGRLKVLP